MAGTAPVAGTAAVAGTATEDICLPGGPACEAPVADEPAEYATPAQVNCPSLGIDAQALDAQAAPAHAFDIRTAFGDCSPPNLLFHYRMSRLPESERPSGALRPQRGRHNARPVTSCTGLPPEHGAPLSIAAAQPLATYAAFSVIPPPVREASFESVHQGSTRVVEPLDRPPRA